jgi:hypothetical protein
MFEISIVRVMTKILSMILMLAVAGCAMNRNQKAVEMERLLAASGFKMKRADTDSQLAKLKELPQRKLVAQNWDGKLTYFYADASNCKCVYIGDEKAYKHFQKLAHQRQIAKEKRRAAEWNESTDMNSGGWQFDKSW